MGARVTNPSGADQGHQKAHSNSTFAKVLFHTFDFGVITATIKKWEGDFMGTADFRSFAKASEALFGALTGFQTTKQLGQASGQWSVSVKGHVIGNWDKSYYEWPALVKDGDWVKIIVVKNGVDHLLMVGRVDSVSLHIQAGSNGEPDISVTFSGRDLGAVAEDTPIYWNPFDPLHSNVAGIGMAKILGDNNARIDGRPDEIVPSLLLGLTSGTTYGNPPMVPNGVFGPLEQKWTDGIDRESFVQKCRGFVYAPQILTAGNNPSVWQYATQWAGPLNEVWLDTLTTDLPADEDSYVTQGKGYLFMRERPFVNATDGDKSPWFKLPHHVISYTSVRGLSLSRGRNRVNHVMVLGELPSTFGGDAMGLFPPAILADSISRWGLRRLEKRTPYMAETDKGGATNFASEYKAWQNLVISWNCLNPEYWDGVVHIGEMIPQMQVGSKLSLIHGPPAGYGGSQGNLFPQDGGKTDKAMSFYVEAVQHTWQTGQSPTVETQVMVSRGYVEGDRIAAVQAAAAQWTRIGDTDGSASEELNDGYDGIDEYEDPDTGVV